MKKVLLVIFCLGLIGCATMSPPTPEQAENADYGRYPDSYKEIVTNFMSDLLIDPYSAVYSDWSGPSKGWAGEGLLGYFFGYRVCVEVNAKNRMGGYGGKKLYLFVINNGQVVYRHGGFRYGSMGREETIKLCNF